MAMQAMSGMGPRAMAGKGAMQQQEVQARPQSQAKIQTQAQAMPQNQASAPEMAAGKVMNVSDAGSAQQSAGQQVGASFGGAEVQFSERSGVGFGTKG